jgi:hypothetical protein
VLNTSARSPILASDEVIGRVIPAQSLLPGAERAVPCWPSVPFTGAGTPITLAPLTSETALEKRVHIVDPALLPDQIMVKYEAPEDLAKREITLDDLPADWGRREILTQRIGDAWLEGGGDPLRWWCLP